MEIGKGTRSISFFGNSSTALTGSMIYDGNFFSAIRLRGLIFVRFGIEKSCPVWTMKNEQILFSHEKKTLSSLELDLMAGCCLISKLFFSCVVWSRGRAPCCWVWGKINMENSVAIHHWTSSFSSSAYVGVSEMETEKRALRGDEWPYCQHHINIMWQTSLCSTAMSIIIIAECWHFETSARAAKWAQKYLPTLARDR